MQKRMLGKIDVNIKRVLYGVAAALPYMRQQKSGQEL
jgi:NADP-dependent 3-hydroxy acid dehydrogenase YdfG